MTKDQKKPKFESLASKIAKAVEFGWKEGLGPQKPYAAFGFQHDPFAYFSPDDSTLVETTNFMGVIQRIMGHFSEFYSKKHSINTTEFYEGHHLLVLGTIDSGRTYLLEFANDALNELSVDNYGNLSTLFIDAGKQWKFTGKRILKTAHKSDDPVTSKYQQFTAWLSENEEKIQQTDILFIDNVGCVLNIFEFIINQILDCGALPLLVASLSIAEYEWIKKEGLQASLDYFSKIPFYLNFSQDPKLTVEILQKRLNASNGKNSPFTNESLHAIVGLTFGLPGLTMWLASEVLTHNYNMKEENITISAVQHVAKQLGFDAANYLLKQFDGPTPQQLILQSALQAAGEARIRLGHSCNRDYAILFGGGITNRKLQDTPIIGDRSKSTISHHLKVLSEDNKFLHVHKKGKSRIYFLERPVLNALELIHCKGRQTQDSLQFQLQE
ncbi:MAG: ArsR/SmtB family transcription factor [Candidatus Hodarchaeota archaeon]